MHEETDRALVERARERDERAFEELVTRHAGRVHRLVARLLGGQNAADDVTQETFVRAWRALPSFRGDAEFTTWLHRIAVNEANRLLAREARRELVLYEDVMEKAPDLAADVPERVESIERHRRLELLLAELPAHYRGAVVLRDVEGYANEEAAELLGLDIRNFKSRLHRGRMALRKQLEEIEGERS
ncbi:sigma70-ECF: RNA polymerase sigma factor 70 [Gaiella occulta]|uniref:RNA polymerase sigma factor n=1 Tax=Gaiella occulta TaxID=1002870 RepID=A0A7M2YVV7_9ACTN|nr:sigma-70 family RNA polymerase sigma factor [Gaiella occulta]RDI74024.1 sigma70-ECF: RNA polymerase sigma factor 70 [Gaiella occulta]